VYDVILHERMMQWRMAQKYMLGDFPKKCYSACLFSAIAA